MSFSLFMCWVILVLLAFYAGAILGHHCGIGECLWRFRTRTAKRRKWLRRQQRQPDRRTW